MVRSTKPVAIDLTGKTYSTADGKSKLQFTDASNGSAQINIQQLGDVSANFTYTANDTAVQLVFDAESITSPLPMVANIVKQYLTTVSGVFSNEMSKITISIASYGSFEFSLAE